QKKITDSGLVYSNAHLAVQQSKKENNQKLLAASYSNLATWHRGNKTIDSTAWYLTQSENIYKNLENDNLLAETYLAFEDAYKERTGYNDAMAYDFKALGLYEKLKDPKGIAICYSRLCDLMYYQEKYQEGADYCQKAIDIQKDIDQPDDLAVSYRFKADNLLILEKYDEALLNINEAINVLKKAGKTELDIMASYNTRGNIYKYLKRYDDALVEYKKNYLLSKENNQERYLIPSLGNIGHVYRLQKKYAKALPYTLEAIAIMKKTGNTQNLWENYMHAADSYDALGQYKKALEYHRLFADEELENKNQTISQLESELQIKYETAKKDETIEEQDAKIIQQKKNQLLYISIAALLGIILVGMYFTMKNIRKKRSELNNLNIELENKQKDLEKSNLALISSIQELKATQNQLIQSEKMASLGELTAGIAHEIQNPLNFVNNFSEVNKELIEELKTQRSKLKTEEIDELLADIASNEEKIIHHGKRADAIVKGMLQHSRSSSGQKEPTDINALCDEYLRLSYHGLRAKDKSFNATMKSDFGNSIGNINIVSQDIGRVILNLINNAFYAVHEKKKEGSAGYEPTVTVSTSRSLSPGEGRGEVTIKVTDNGNGIPESVKEKIFQPFFTTKPTGQGTGLGLSLSYDIIKAHSGEIKVNTKENEGTEFIIQLPVS
ncbi:MAG: ATP-binding protein, partial [Ferruginibacter sp.]